MAKLDEEVRQLKERIEAAHEARMRARGQQIAAEEALQQARTQLLDEFKVDITQAHVLLAQLEAEAASELEKVKQHLAAAEDQA